MLHLRRSPVRRAGVLAALVALAASSAAGAQPLTPAGANRGPLDLPTLVALPAEALTIRYSLGHLDRAAHLQIRLGALAAVLASWTPAGLDAGAYVLAPEEWQQALAGRPTALPARVGGTWLGFAAVGDDTAVAFWRDAGALPQLEGRPLRGTPEHVAALAMGDVLAGPALVLAWLEGTGRGPADPQLAGLLAHVVTGAVASGVSLVELPAIDAAWDRLAGLPPGAGGVLLQEVREAARLRVAARRLLAAHPGYKVRRWLDHRARSGQTFDRAALVERFPEIPGLLAVATSADAPPPPR